MIDRGQYFFEMKTFSFLNFIDASKTGQKAVCSVQLQTIYWNGCHAIISDLSLCFIQSSYHHILIGQSWYRHEFLVNHHCKLVNPTNNLDTTLFSTKMKKYQILAYAYPHVKIIKWRKFYRDLDALAVKIRIAIRHFHYRNQVIYSFYFTTPVQLLHQNFSLSSTFSLLGIAAARTAINSSSSLLLLSVSMFVEKRKLNSFSKLFLQNRYDEQVFCI